MAKNDSFQLWSASYRLLTAVINEVSPRVTELGLEMKELFVLAEVDEFPHPAALASRLCMPKPTITFYSKRLEAAGLVKREIDPSDLRRHRLVVTPAGRKVLGRGMAALSEAYGARLKRLSSAEQSALGAMLQKMS